MDKAVWSIGEARLCPECQLAMLPEYVMRCMGEQRRDLCQRCGKVKPATMVFKYTMRGKVKERRGLF